MTESQNISQNVSQMSRFGLGFTGDPLKLHYRYYPLLWFEDSPCCPFRSQPITASVVKTNGVCRSHQSDLPVYCVIWSPHEIDSSPGTEWMSYFAQTHSHVRRIPSTFTGTIYSRVFLLTLPAESQQRGRKTHLPVKQYVIVQSHAKFSPQTPVQRPQALVHAKETGLDSSFRNLQLNQTKRTIQPHCRQPLFSHTGSAITLPFYLLVVSLMKLLTIKSKTV